jgi:hypothetical protein
MFLESLEPLEHACSMALAGISHIDAPEPPGDVLEIVINSDHDGCPVKCWKSLGKSILRNK